VYFFSVARGKCLCSASKGSHEITDKRVHSLIDTIEPCCLLSCPDNKNRAHHLILSNVGPVRFGPDDLVDLALMAGRPARAVSFHTPSGNLFEDSSTTDFIAAGLFLYYGWLTPLMAVQSRTHYQTNRVRLQVKPFTCIQKTTVRTLSAGSQGWISPVPERSWPIYLQAAFVVPLR